MDQPRTFEPPRTKSGQDQDELIAPDAARSLYRRSRFRSAALSFEELVKRLGMRAICAMRDTGVLSELARLWANDWPHPVSFNAPPNEGEFMDFPCERRRAMILVDNPAQFFSYYST